MSRTRTFCGIVVAAIDEVRCKLIKRSESLMVPFRARRRYPKIRGANSSDLRKRPAKLFSCSFGSACNHFEKPVTAHASQRVHEQNTGRDAMAKNCDNGEKFAAAANFAPAIVAADARQPGLLGHVRIVRARARLATNA